ncbi:MAG: lytic transglycosylase domain-containing protein [Paracoccaceae bacterium]
MTFSRMLPIVLGFAWPLVCGSAEARILAPGTEPDLCFQAAKEASRQTGVPLKVLIALTLTETGRKLDGHLQPWPWALNEAGDSHWLPDRQTALVYLTDAVATGTTNIDVGCFQLNYRWHGAAFSSLEQMFDPLANALYAASLVRRLAGESDDWVAAAGAYHSGTPDVADRYLAKFEPIYAALQDKSSPVQTPKTVTRSNAFPLLQSSGKRSAGSLVALSTARHPLIGGP